MGEYMDIREKVFVRFRSIIPSLILNEEKSDVGRVFLDSQLGLVEGLVSSLYRMWVGKSPTNLLMCKGIS
jgi:hypothetical protein